MHKSKDITKYNIHWQIVRVQLKDVKNIDEKLEKVSHFFINNKTIDNKERVINWLEGLSMGYKASKNMDAILKIESEICRYEIIEVADKEINEISNSAQMKQYERVERKKLWDDLFDRNRKWLNKGYYQEEINLFMDNIYLSFSVLKDPVIEYDYEVLLGLREAAKKMKNTHKFFF